MIASRPTFLFSLSMVFLCCGQAAVRAQCACDPDVNGNGVVDIDDTIAISRCVGGDCTRCAGSACDVDCDGDVDACDVGKFNCGFEGGADCCNTVVCGACCDTTCAETALSVADCTASILGGVYLGDGTTCDTCAPCPCDPNVNGFGIADVDDIIAMSMCIGGDCSECDGSACDIDCDGDVDLCDLGKLTCGAFGPPGSDCCNTVACGACCAGKNNCTQADPSVSDCSNVNGGFYLGDDTTCADACPPYGDIFPCDTGSGSADIDDILAVLAAFSGSPPCP